MSQPAPTCCGVRAKRYVKTWGAHGRPGFSSEFGFKCPKCRAIRIQSGAPFDGSWMAGMEATRLEGLAFDAEKI